MEPIDLNAARWVDIPGTNFELDERRVSGAWVVMREPGSREVAVRFAVAAGATRVVGLRLDDGDAISSRQLREIRISAMESAFARYMSATDERLNDIENAVVSAYDDLPPGGPSEQAEDLHGNLSVVESMRSSHDRWQAALEASASHGLRARGRGASPPTDDELAAFAEVYRRELLGGRGAIKRTAEAVGMERTTVYRWVERCRNKQLLTEVRGAGR